MIYTKYILFSLLLVCPSVFSAQGIIHRFRITYANVCTTGKLP